VIYRSLGRTGLQIPAISFGAGPVSGLMTGTDDKAQFATVQRAIASGINWFDTAPGYGKGASETNLGRVLAELGASKTVHIATKVRIPREELDRIGDYVRRSVEGSLLLLGVPRVTLLQLHNWITFGRGDEPESITPREVLGLKGVLQAFRRLQEEGAVEFLGLTGAGQADAIREVIGSSEFDTIQVPFNILNPSAGVARSSSEGEVDYGNVIGESVKKGMGVFAIRVFAGGALLDQSPSAHTLTTPFFPLALYEHDRELARQIRERVACRMSLVELAVRFALSHPAVSSAIVGFGSPAHVDEMARVSLEEPLPAELRAILQKPFEIR